METLSEQRDCDSHEHRALSIGIHELYLVLWSFLPAFRFAAAAAVFLTAVIVDIYFIPPFLSSGMNEISEIRYSRFNVL